MFGLKWMNLDAGFTVQTVDKLVDLAYGLVEYRDPSLVLGLQQIFSRSCASAETTVKLKDGRRRFALAHVMRERESKNAISIHGHCLALPPPLCVESGVVD